MNNRVIIELTYITAAVLFCFGIKMLSSPKTARKGNLVSAFGMLLAVVATLLYKGLDLRWIVAGMALGAVTGVLAARLVQMTAMPQMVAVFNGFGGAASLLVAWSEYHIRQPERIGLMPIAVAATVIIGAVTFTGSMIAYAKLAERIPGRPILFPHQHLVNAVLGITALGCTVIFLMSPAAHYALFLFVMLIALVLGILLVIPIGGADMPVVICLLNSYSGLAAAAAGFVILNNVLIVSGALVGASGIILTRIMCKAMNRSLANVLFGGFGAVRRGKEGYRGEVKSLSVEDAYYLLEAARSVIFVPGYGMAAAQAQHVVRELGELLESNGAEVKYCIHPVAGRMPGHMNVLLAEANVPYEQLVEPEDVNPIMDTVDVAVVIGANDVVNPAARDEPGSPLYGMPIIEVDRARTCIVIKRSLNPGFAGVDNPLFFKPNTRMLFGDAKEVVSALVAEFKEAA